MTLPIQFVKRGHHNKPKGLLDFSNSKEAVVDSPDVTERVLAEVKGLKENYERHYAEIESRVKKRIQGPVKSFTMHSRHREASGKGIDHPQAARTHRDRPEQEANLARASGNRQALAG